MDRETADLEPRGIVAGLLAERHTLVMLAA
jgi:hypothetical protein